ncbi:MAG: hypothetical protein NDI93_19900 [Pseudomonas sp.]|nr:hypothetical protein [Pseudomonas sp.]
MDNRRVGWWLLFLGGAAVLALIPEYFFAPEEALVVPPVQRSEAVAPPLATRPAGEGAGTPGTPLPAASAPGGAPPGGGLFSAHSWRVAPPPAPAPAWTPPPPVAAAPPAGAPALPFEFIGKMDDAERLRVFLLRDEKIYTVTVGEVIDGTYRVERIADSEMVLTYLPLNVRQTLSVGGKL